MWVRGVMRVQGCREGAGMSWGYRDVMGVQGCHGGAGVRWGGE